MDRACTSCHNACMREQAVQYTVRGVPADVDRALRDRAARQKKSVNQVILDELTNATIGTRQIADFSDLVGRLQPDSAFDDILESQRKVDLDDWR